MVGESGHQRSRSTEEGGDTGQRMGTAPCGQAGPRSSLHAAPGGAQLQRGLGTLGAGVPASSRRSPG